LSTDRQTNRWTVASGGLKMCCSAV